MVRVVFLFWITVSSGYYDYEEPQKPKREFKLPRSSNAARNKVLECYHELHGNVARDHFLKKYPEHKRFGREELAQHTVERLAERKYGVRRKIKCQRGDACGGYAWIPNARRYRDKKQQYLGCVPENEQALEHWTKDMLPGHGSRHTYYNYNCFTDLCNDHHADEFSSSQIIIYGVCGVVSAIIFIPLCVCLGQWYFCGPGAAVRNQIRRQRKEGIKKLPQESKGFDKYQQDQYQQMQYGGQPQQYR